MLESPKREKEDSDERNAIQSGEDHWHFEGGGVQDQYRWRRKYSGLSQVHLRLDSLRVFVL